MARIVVSIQVAAGVVRTFEDHGFARELVRPAYLRPIDDALTELVDLPGRYPGLVSTHELGRSVEGRPLVAVELTSAADARPKPSLLVSGNRHSGEVATGPLVAAELQGFAAGYGVDPLVTGILDSRVLRAIPYSNPDGRAVVDHGYATGDVEELFFRTNARGVDLNRNFPFAHGATEASRGSAGPRAGSEPETRAHMTYVTRWVPDADLDVHQQGGRLLVPYGHTAEPPPDDAGLRAFAGGIAARTGYRVESSNSFTRGGTSGTSKDWAYGTFRVPAATMELAGPYHFTDAELAAAVPRHAAALLWAANVADAPWSRPAGPAVVRLDVGGARHAVEVLAKPGGAGRTVASVEVYHDPLTPAGAGEPLVRRADRWVAPGGALARLDASHGSDLLYARAVDDAGVWGAFEAAWMAGPRRT